MLQNDEFVAMLPVSDIERAKRWYSEKLGFQPVAEHDGGAHYRAGSARFDLYTTQFAGTAQHRQAGWMVDDIEGAVDEMRGRGVVFEEYDFPGLKMVQGIADLGYERAAWFKDSEGNILSLGQATL
jgi:catechol 2,3-dioxygenase-like lactoylglutathione lyase family enzyme